MALNAWKSQVSWLDELAAGLVEHGISMHFGSHVRRKSTGRGFQFEVDKLLPGINDECLGQRAKPLLRLALSGGTGASLRQLRWEQL